MKQWDVYMWKFPGADDHPAVIVSSPARITHKDDVNVLLCSSQRAGRSPKEHEVMLDSVDGLDWETLCKCDFLFAASKSDLVTKRGAVSPYRRRAIVAKIVQSMGWAGI